MSNRTTLTLAEFLLARYAEDEADAEAAAGLKGGSPFARDDYGRLLVDPARVLADCEAKRRIVEKALPGESDDRGERARILRILASVYADHPDYRQEWRL